MFAGAKKFNKNIGGWNVSGVEKMYGMFSGATAFNQDIGRWNVSNVSNMTEMFFQAASFDQDLSGWTLNAVKDSREIFNIFGESGLKKENYCKIITNSVFLQFDEVLGLGYACSSEAAEPEA